MRVHVQHQNRWLTLEQPLGRGGEATVYAVKGQPSLAAKVFTTPPNQVRLNKLRQMLRQIPGGTTLAWPQDLLVAKGGRVVGYLMPRVKGHTLSLIYHPASRRRHCPGVAETQLLRIARNLCIAVGQVHRAGHVIGDLNDANALVNDRTLVTLIDCDSFQIGGHLCSVGRPEYLAPELQGLNLRQCKRRQDHDLFALAVLVHLLLRQGYHPFAGLGDPPALDARIRIGYTCYAPNGPPPSPAAPGPASLSPELQALFRRTFVTGHRDPGRRPSAAEWERTLSQEETRRAVVSGIIPLSKPLPVRPSPVAQFPIPHGQRRFFSLGLALLLILVISAFTWPWRFPLREPIGPPADGRQTFHIAEPAKVKNQQQPNAAVGETSELKTTEEPPIGTRIYHRFFPEDMETP